MNFHMHEEHTGFLLMLSRLNPEMADLSDKRKIYCKCFGKEDRLEDKKTIEGYRSFLFVGVRQVGLCSNKQVDLRTIIPIGLLIREH
jgi:hypothetical protein